MQLRQPRGGRHRRCNACLPCIHLQKLRPRTLDRKINAMETLLNLLKSMKTNHQMLFEAISDENRARHEQKELIEESNLEEEKKQEILDAYEMQKEVIKTKQSVTADTIEEIEKAIQYIEGDRE